MSRFYRDNMTRNFNSNRNCLIVLHMNCFLLVANFNVSLWNEHHETKKCIKMIIYVAFINAKVRCSFYFTVGTENWNSQKLFELFKWNGNSWNAKQQKWFSAVKVVLEINMLCDIMFINIVYLFLYLISYYIGSCSKTWGRFYKNLMLFIIFPPLALNHIPHKHSRFPFKFAQYGWLTCIPQQHASGVGLGVMLMLSKAMIIDADMIRGIIGGSAEVNFKESFCMYPRFY